MTSAPATVSYDLGKWGRYVVMPKRAFADGGAAFWRFADDRLTGRRYFRASPARTTLVNTAST